MENWDIYSAHAAVVDPDTSPADLAVIAHKYSVLWSTIKKHPAASEALVNWIEEQNALAENELTIRRGPNSIPRFPAGEIPPGDATANSAPVVPPEWAAWAPPTSPASVTETPPSDDVLQPENATPSDDVTSQAAVTPLDDDPEFHTIIKSREIKIPPPLPVFAPLSTPGPEPVPAPQPEAESVPATLDVEVPLEVAVSEVGTTATYIPSADETAIVGEAPRSAAKSGKTKLYALVAGITLLALIGAGIATHGFGLFNHTSTNATPGVTRNPDNTEPPVANQVPPTESGGEAGSNNEGTGAANPPGEPNQIAAPRMLDDREGALGDRATEVQTAIEALAEQTGVNVFIVYMDSFGNEEPAYWANQIAQESGLGVNEVLLVLAVGSGDYGVSVDQDSAIPMALLEDFVKYLPYAFAPVGGGIDWTGGTIGALNHLLERANAEGFSLLAQL